MTIREANKNDVEALKDLYFNHLTQYPPKEPQDIEAWKQIVSMMADDDMHLRCWKRHWRLQKSTIVIKFSLKRVPIGREHYISMKKMDLKSIRNIHV